jgi:GntR family transcriptional repressor for pyruvate dehydrogenase complex
MATEISRVGSINLVDAVVDQMRGLIMSGKYGDHGELPVEADLCEQFGVSRTVTREAMRTLQAQGLVEISRGRTPRVRPADPRVPIESLKNHLQRSSISFAQLLEVRRLLENEIAAVAATMAGGADLKAMNAAIERQLHAKGLAAQVEADIAFHNALALSTGNPIYHILLETLAPLMSESRRKAISRVGVERAVMGHRTIYAAIERRDPSAAREAMSLHLQMAKEDQDD